MQDEETEQKERQAGEIRRGKEGGRSREPEKEHRERRTRGEREHTMLVDYC